MYATYVNSTDNNFIYIIDRCSLYRIEYRILNTHGPKYLPIAGPQFSLLLKINLNFEIKTHNQY